MKKKFIFENIFCLIIIFLLFLPCDNTLYCTGVMAEKLQYPFLWSLLLIPISLFALVLKDEKYKFWIKYTGIFFVISMVIVYMTPEYGSGIVSIDRELTNWFFAGFYSLSSIVYFIVQFVKNRRITKSF